MSSKPRRFPVPRRHGDVRTAPNAPALHRQTSLDALAARGRRTAPPRTTGSRAGTARGPRVFPFPSSASPRFGPETHRARPSSRSSFRTTDQRDQHGQLAPKHSQAREGRFRHPQAPEDPLARAHPSQPRGEAEGVATPATVSVVRARRACPPRCSGSAATACSVAC